MAVLSAAVVKYERWETGVTEPIDPGHETDGKGPTGSTGTPDDPKGDGKGPTAR